MTARRSGPATLFVMVGLPASGKTTRARELEEEHHAIRLTPDEWMIPLFNDSDADGKRDVLEGRFIAIARQALRGCSNVILDFGVWSRDERSALRALAAEANARCTLVYLTVEPLEQRKRLSARSRTHPSSTFEITDEQLVEFAILFEVPEADELGSTEIESPPHGHATWAAWTAERWPTSLA